MLSLSLFDCISSTTESHEGGGLAAGTLLLIGTPCPILDDIASPKTVEDQTKSFDPESQGLSGSGATRTCQKYSSVNWIYTAFLSTLNVDLQTALTSSSRFGHYYDVSKTMDPEIRQAARCHAFYLPEHSTTVTLSPTATVRSPMPESYSSLLNNLQEVIHAKALMDPYPSHGHALTTFLYGFRAMLRSSLSVAMVTVASHLIQNRALMDNITRLCDTAIALESFRGSERETNPLYKDHHGLLDVRQVPYLNCLVCDLPGNKDLAFKLKRKQFTIESGRAADKPSDATGPSSSTVVTQTLEQVFKKRQAA